MSSTSVVWIPHAEQLGLPFQGPPRHPYNPLRALRMCCAMEDNAARLALALAQALMVACWEQEQDLSDFVALAAPSARERCPEPVFGSRGVGPAQAAVGIPVNPVL